MWIDLSPDWCWRCASYAKNHIAHNKENKVLHSSGASIKDGRDLYSDTDLQSAARAGEVAACLALGLDPMLALKWHYDWDGGADFKIGNYTVDVKTSTHLAAQYLIWKKTALDKLPQAADILMFCKLTAFPEGNAEVEIVGWQWKKIFQKAPVARGIPGIIDGTPAMHKRDLRPVEDIIAHFATQLAPEHSPAVQNGDCLSGV